MLTCINKNRFEYQTLKKKSGIQDSVLESICRSYLDQYNRFPYLDEILNADSKPALKEAISINQYNGAKISDILAYTGTSTIEEANAAINNEFRDIEVEFTPIVDEVLVDIIQRPTINNFEDSDIEIDLNPDTSQILNNIVDKFSTLYGINMNIISDHTLTEEQWKDLAPLLVTKKAFILNGEIYINIDRSSVDSPIHELMHILIGDLRFKSPTIYQELLNVVSSIIVQDNINRTFNDLAEETLVTELSKFVTNQPSILSEISDTLQYEIFYNISRALDTILMGKDSVRTLSVEETFNMSLKELVKSVKSTIMTTSFKGTLNMEDSALHRKLNNIKSDLMKQKQLKEQCQ